MSYGHAASVLLTSGKKSPAPELNRVVRLLKKWADANPQAPALHELYLDAQACHRDLVAYLAATDPPAPKIPPEIPS